MPSKRRNLIFVPGNNAALFKDVFVYRPDIVVFDLEDSISIKEKDAARELTRRMLLHFDYHPYNIETSIRINDLQTPYYLLDLHAAVSAKVDIIKLPKASTADDILQLEHDLEVLEQEMHSAKKSLIFPIIESATGVNNAVAIAAASERVMGVSLGGIDYLLDIGGTQTSSRTEILYARQAVVNAAKAAQIVAFDVVYADVNNLEGLREECEFAKTLGFTGKLGIHPSQIEIMNEVFAPSKTEVANAIAILKAYHEYSLHGSKGVFQLNGKMVDKPVIEQAKKTLMAAGVKL